MLLAKYASLIVPSSAASGREFSVLKRSLSLVEVYQALEDRTEIQFKTRYNHKQNKWHDDKNSSFMTFLIVKVIEAFKNLKTHGIRVMC